MADIQYNMVYDPQSGTWQRQGFHRPDMPQEKEQTQPKTDPAPPTAKPASTQAGESGTSAEKKYRERLFNLEGTAEVIPDPHVEARSVVEFQGLGKQFSGRYFVTAVIHRWNTEGYQQSLEVRRNGFGGEADTGQTPAEQSSRPPKETVAPVTKDRYYTVKSGDTLWSIAKQFYGNGAEYPKIAAANNLSNPNLIRVGQRLLIP